MIDPTRLKSNVLRRIIAWRRGDETVGQPAPGHFGDVLDAADESLASGHLT